MQVLRPPTKDILCGNKKMLCLLSIGLYDKYLVDTKVLKAENMRKL